MEQLKNSVIKQFPFHRTHKILLFEAVFPPHKKAVLSAGQEGTQVESGKKKTRKQIVFSPEAQRVRRVDQHKGTLVISHAFKFYYRKKLRKTELKQSETEGDRNRQWHCVKGKL